MIVILGHLKCDIEDLVEYFNINSAPSIFEWGAMQPFIVEFPKSYLDDLSI